MPADDGAFDAKERRVHRVGEAQGGKAMNRALRCGFGLAASLALLVDAWASTDPPACPTVTFTGSEVYLYGHGPYTVNTLSVEGDTVRINGIPVFPGLRRPTPERKVVVDERTRAEFALDRQAAAVEQEMLAKGVTEDLRLEAMMEVYRSAPSLVDSVVPTADGDFWIWWRGHKTGPTLVFVNCSMQPPSPSPQERIGQYYNEFRILLEGGNFLIITTSTGFMTRLGGGDINGVRLEIDRARAATSPLTPETWPHGRLPYSIAEQFRSPLPIAGVED